MSFETHNYYVHKLIAKVSSYVRCNNSHINIESTCT